MAEISKRLGRKALALVPCSGQARHNLGLVSRLIAAKFDGFKPSASGVGPESGLS